MPASADRLMTRRGTSPARGDLRQTHPVSRPVSLLALAVALGSPLTGQAQIRASERATVSQTADGTVFTINYSRPRARGRTALFGKVVPWGETWTPGANWATTLEINRDVTLDGHAVPKGKYSVWFVVRPGTWTFVLDPRVQLYHEEHPDSTADQLRWSITSRTASFTEVLTWSFPEVRPDGTQLLFQWGTRTVAINATVDPSHPIAIARADAEPYLGVYEWRWADDTTSAAAKVELYYENGEIRQRHTPFPDWYPRLQNQPMVRINDDWFIGAIRRDGKVWEMVADMIFEFDVKDGRALGFELYSDKDEKLGSGTRVSGR